MFDFWIQNTPPSQIKIRCLIQIKTAHSFLHFLLIPHPRATGIKGVFLFQIISTKYFQSTSFPTISDSLFAWGIYILKILNQRNCVKFITLLLLYIRTDSLYSWRINFLYSWTQLIICLIQSNLINLIW